MKPNEAVAQLIEMNWSDRRIAKALGSSQSTIFRIRHGMRQATFELGNAIIALAKKEAKKQEKCDVKNDD